MQNNFSFRGACPRTPGTSVVPNHYMPDYAPKVSFLLLKKTPRGSYFQMHTKDILYRQGADLGIFGPSVYCFFKD